MRMKKLDELKSNDYADDVVPVYTMGGLNQLTQYEEEIEVPIRNPIGFIWEVLPKHVPKRRRVGNRMGVRFVPEQG